MFGVRCFPSPEAVVVDTIFIRAAQKLPGPARVFEFIEVAILCHQLGIYNGVASYDSLRCFPAAVINRWPCSSSAWCTTSWLKRA